MMIVAIHEMLGYGDDCRTLGMMSWRYFHDVASKRILQYEALHSFHQFFDPSVVVEPFSKEEGFFRKMFDELMQHSNNEVFNRVIKACLDNGPDAFLQCRAEFAFATSMAVPFDASYSRTMEWNKPCYILITVTPREEFLVRIRTRMDPREDVPSPYVASCEMYSVPKEYYFYFYTNTYLRANIEWTEECSDRWDCWEVFETIRRGELVSCYPFLAKGHTAGMLKKRKRAEAEAVTSTEAIDTVGWKDRLAFGEISMRKCEKSGSYIHRFMY